MRHRGAHQDNGHRKSRKDPNDIRGNGHREKDLLNKQRDKGEPEYMRQAPHDTGVIGDPTRTMDIEKRRCSRGYPRALNRWLNAHGNTWILI